MKLWKLSLRQAQGRPGRVVLTLFSVVIGVAATVSVSLSIATTRRVYQQMSEAMVGRAGIEVVPAAGGTLNEDILPILERTPGVKAVAPTLRRGTILYHNGKRAKLLVFGIDPVRDAAVRDYELQAGRIFNATADEAALDASFARSLDIKVGDEIKILVPSRASLARLRRVKVVGLLTLTGVSGVVQGTTLLMPLQVVQRLFAAQGELDSASLVLEPGLHGNALLPELYRRLPPGAIARVPLTHTSMAEETLGSVEMGLQVASCLSLILAAIIILNTFLMSVTERRSQFAILRAIGATRGQIIRLLLIESLILGTGGTILGLLVGLAGAKLLTHMMSQLQSSLPQVEIQLAPMLIGCLLGIGVSVLAGMLPAFRAGSVSPIEGMRAGHTQSIGKYLRITAWVGVASLLLGSTLIVVSLLRWITAPVGLPAGMMVLIGFVLMIPIVLVPMVRLASWPLRFFTPVEANLARGQLVRHPVRTTLTGGVLFIGTAACVCLGVVILDNIQDVRGWVNRTLIADFYVRSAMPNMSSDVAVEIPDGIGAEIREIPGVKHAGSVRNVSIHAAGQPVILVAKQFSPADRLPLDLKVGTYEDVRRKLQQGEVVIGAALAQKTHLTAGDQISLETPSGLRRFQIAGVANEYMFGGLTLSMDSDVAAKWLNVHGADIYLITVKPGTAADVGKALRKITDESGLILQSNATLRELVDRVMAGFVGCLWSLLALAMLVASFGVVNTLTMNVLEQTRELALLRVVAMTRRQVRRTVLGQAAIVGLISLVPGTVIGVFLAYLVIVGSAATLGHWLDFDAQPTALFCAFVGAYLIVLAAALAPARRAARLELLAALHYE